MLRNIKDEIRYSKLTLNLCPIRLRASAQHSDEILYLGWWEKWKGNSSFRQTITHGLIPGHSGILLHKLTTSGHPDVNTKLWVYCSRFRQDGIVYTIIHEKTALKLHKLHLRVQYPKVDLLSFLRFLRKNGKQDRRVLYHKTEREN